MFAMGRLLAAHDLMEKKTGELWGQAGAAEGLTLLRFFTYCMIPVTLGNIIGGGRQSGERPSGRK